MEKISVNEFISKSKVLKKQQLRKRRSIVLGLILVTGLLIMNWKTLFASQEQMKKSADIMSRYIIAEAQYQGDKVDFKKVCKQAKKLDETGLRITYEEDGQKTTIYFFKDQDPTPIQVAVLEIPKK